MTGYVVGVDGGGTHTRAIVLDRGGAVVGRADGSAAVADARDPARAASAVADTCRAAAHDAGLALPFGALWAGLSGAGREAARSAVELELRRLGVAEAVRVGTDVAAAFHDAFGDGPGVLLIAGTGSIAWGRSEDGREGRVGGWGQHIGDEGSGYAVGLEALRRITRQVDGRAPRTRLQVAVLDFLGFTGADDLVYWAAGATKAQVAGLAPVVAAAARAGDAAASEILSQAVADLEGHVLAILENLGPWEEPPVVALGGGLLGPGRPLRAPLEQALARHRVAVLQRSPDPAAGAARMALGGLSL